LKSGIARKHGVLPRPFLGRPQYSPPTPQKIYFLPKNTKFLKKESWGFSNWQFQGNVFNRAKLFGEAINPVLSWGGFNSFTANGAYMRHLLWGAL
jgi:hypothetical protein